MGDEVYLCGVVHGDAVGPGQARGDDDLPIRAVQRCPLDARVHACTGEGKMGGGMGDGQW